MVKRMAAFTVEVAAETNPLSGALLEQTLQKATSSDQAQLQTATKQLQAWETKPSFFSDLQKIYMKRDTQTSEVRMLALIYLKNGVDKYWRKSAANAIRPEERNGIRANLLQSTLTEPVDRLASMNAIVTAKVARHDFPSQWPELISQLSDFLTASVGDVQAHKQTSRALLLTHCVVKELSTVRLARNRAAFLAAAPTLLGVLQNCYFGIVNLWQAEIHAGQGPSIDTLHKMSTSEQILKIIRRLVVAGYDFPHRQAEVRDFWDSTSTHVQVYLQLLHSEDLQNAYRISASEHLKQLAKLHVNMAKEHPVSFALLPTTATLVSSYWTAAKELRNRQLQVGTEIDDDVSDVYTKLNLQTLLLLRACFREAYTLSQPFKYRNSDGKDEPPQARKLLTEQVLTEDFVKELFETLITKFFLYLQSDIEEWTSEAEEWEMKDEGDEEAYDRSVRAAAERLFLDITLHYRDLVIEPLLHTAATINTSAETSATLKDAVYCGLGIAAPILHSRFDYNSFLQTNIVKDMQEQDQHHTIVRRRISVVLAQWISINTAEQNKALVYQIYQNLLDPRIPLNDQVVRITAAKRLRIVVDEIGFEKEDFVSVASNILQSLLNLIEEVSLPETKLALMETISAVVERMEHAVTPFADQIVKLLTNLWDSTSENMMRVSIVSILSILVTAMGADSRPLHHMMANTVRLALDPDSEYKTSLMGDALDLWASLLAQAQSPAPDYATALIPMLFHLLEIEDGLDKILKLLKSYVLLAPSDILQGATLEKVLTALAPLLNSKTSIIVTVTEIVELIIRAAESLHGEGGVETITQALVHYNLLPLMLESLRQNWECHQTTGPNRKAPPNDWKNETDYFVILARIILGSTKSFLNGVETFAQTSVRSSESLDATMTHLLDECLSHMDAISSPASAKLICMSLTKLLDTGQPWILVKLQELMSIWSSMITELAEGSDSRLDDSLVMKETIASDGSLPEEDRKSRAVEADPVHTTRLAEFVAHHLRIAIDLVGGSQRFQEEWLVNVDKTVIDDFGKLGIM